MQSEPYPQGGSNKCRALIRICSIVLLSTWLCHVQIQPLNSAELSSNAHKLTIDVGVYSESPKCNTHTIHACLHRKRCRTQSTCSTQL